jgi:hypothetical protein
MDRLIPDTADREAYRANAEAIDSLVKAERHRFVVAWGKWLGFTPEEVQDHVAEAEADNAPHNAIQKMDGAWLTTDEIRNGDNLRKVTDIAAGELPPSVMSTGDMFRLADWCMAHLGLAYHPDTRAAEYVTDDGSQYFDSKTAALLDRLHDEAFALPDADQIYQYGMERFLGLR